jgi:trans-L-3-hydroxyproline dehydratase
MAKSATTQKSCAKNHICATYDPLKCLEKEILPDDFSAIDYRLTTAFPRRPFRTALFRVLETILMPDCPETLVFPGQRNPIDVIDMHTGGEPLRIVTGGFPPVLGENILAKRRYVRERLDHLRQFLMFEPRGHADMYGALLVEPSLQDADFAVLFIHNEGYSTMCGHAMIALGRYAVDYKLVKAVEPVTVVNIECPCGLVRTEVNVTNGRAGRVSFSSVPSFLFGRDYHLKLANGQTFTCDIAYGGAFYALADANQFNLSVRQSNIRDMVDIAEQICTAVNEVVTLYHPDHSDLAFLYGAILTDGNDTDIHTATRNICVFAQNQVDRSPTGSGVSARLAAQFAKGQIAQHQPRLFESVVGSRFTGEVKAITRCGAFDAIIARVGGIAHYSGQSRFWLDEGDVIGQGFRVR